MARSNGAIAWYRDPLSALLIVLLGALIVCLLSAFIAKETWHGMAPTQSQDYAAWAQAIGSVLAVGASAGIVFWQTRRQYRLQLQTERRHKLSAEFEFISALVQMSNGAAARIASATAAMADVASATEYITVKRDAQHLDLIEQALSETDYRRLGSPVYELAFLQVRKQFSLARSHVDRLVAHPGFVHLKMIEHSAATLAKHRDELLHNAAALSGYCDQVRNRVAEQERDDLNA